MILAATLALMITLILVMVRLALGPTVFDRLQAASTIGTVAMLLLAVLSFLNGRPEFLDLAIRLWSAEYHRHHRCPQIFQTWRPG